MSRSKNLDLEEVVVEDKSPASKSSPQLHKKSKSSKEHRSTTHKEHKERKHKKSKKSKSHRRSKSKSPHVDVQTASEEVATQGASSSLSMEKAMPRAKGNQAACDSGSFHQTFDDSVANGEIVPETTMESPEVSSGQRVEELSIEETNKLRAKLGLKPLQVGKGDGTSSSKKEDVHAPPVNLSHVKESEKIKEKISVQKEKRLLEKKYRTVKGLGESSDEEESVDTWVQKSRMLEEARQKEEKRKAEERAKLLDEFDLEQEEADVKPRLSHYSTHDLRGLKVEHDLEHFQDGREIILTLKDSDILKNDDGDVLVSTALTEEEKNRRNIENRKKKADYNPYEDADDMEALDQFGQSKVLKKYDETIGGEKKKAFVLGQSQEDVFNARKELEARPGVRIDQLICAPQHLAKDYYSEQEMAKFKKPKRVKKVRKGHGEAAAAKARSRIIDDDEMPSPNTAPSSALVEMEDDHDLQLALNQVRRARQQELFLSAGKVESKDFIESLKSNEAPIPSGPFSSSTSSFMDDTSEFCRSIGGAMTVQKAVNVKDEFASTSSLNNRYPEVVDMDIDEDAEESEAQRGGWSEVQFEAEPANLGSDEEEEGRGEFPTRKRPRKVKSDGSGKSSDYKSVLDNEPSLERGVAAALKLAAQKGLIDQTGVVKPYVAAPGSKPSSIPQQEYIVEDKIMDDDKRSRHDRYAGPLVAFKEKPGYKPGFRLEYHDVTGRELNAKEAFRDLSHKFHGKGPGKLKTERRTKKYLEEKLMREMSSTDTPLHTVEKMKQKQQELQTPFILLSGSQTKAGPTPISKRVNP